MNRKFAIFAAALAVLFLAAQSADAGPRRHVDPRIRATNTGVGLAWTGVSLAVDSAAVAGAITGTTIGCMATGPMAASAVLGRPLKYREAHIVIGSCLIPFIGGWLVNEAYNNGWLWAPDEEPVRKVRYRHGRR